MKILSIISHPQKEIIKERIKIIHFFDQYGEKPTKEAFKVSRSTIYLWKKKLRESEGRLISLAPLSKAPKNPRKSLVNPAIIEFVKNYRTEHPGVGKETIHSELKEHCQLKSLKLISESTIGRIIQDLKTRNLIPDKNSKLSFYAKTGRFKVKRLKPRETKLRRKDYQPEKPGDLVQIDSITIFLNGLKRYILTAIDLKTEFGFAFAYKSLSSKKATDFVLKLQRIAPFSIRRIQTDNGREFAHLFRDYLQRQKIIHFYNYPGHPQSNSQVERFNRTIQEQYVNWHLDELCEPEQFNQGLMEYLLWYNTRKSHRTLNKIPPLRYYLDTFINDSKQSNMLWTLTGTA